MTKTLVSEAMVKNPYTISPDKSVFEASWLMRSHRIGGLLVVDKGKLVGIITVVDIKRVRGREKQTKIKDVMNNPIVGYPDEDILTVRKRMNEKRIGRMPIVSREDQRVVVGLLSRSQFDDHPDMIHCEYHGGEVERKSIIHGKCPVCGAPLHSKTPVIR